MYFDACIVKFAGGNSAAFSVYWQDSPYYLKLFLPVSIFLVECGHIA